jgi:hypothetical protein
MRILNEDLRLIPISFARHSVNTETLAARLALSSWEIPSISAG